MDVTKNLFFWFRGPSIKGKHQHVQLENNLTKSFINVLEHCDRKVVLGAFLAKLGLPQSKQVAFSLQKRPRTSLTVDKRIVLCITGGETEVTEK